MKLIALTLTPNASLVLAFGSEADRDEALETLRDSLPREVHSKVRSGVTAGGSGSHVLTIRVQDISHPLTITLGNGAPTTIAETDSLDVTNGRETFNRLPGLSGVSGGAGKDDSITGSGPAPQGPDKATVIKAAPPAEAPEAGTPAEGQPEEAGAVDVSKAGGAVGDAKAAARAARLKEREVKLAAAEAKKAEAASDAGKAEESDPEKSKLV